MDMGDWITKTDGKNTYFYNKETLEVSWTLPHEALAGYMARANAEDSKEEAGIDGAPAQGSEDVAGEDCAEDDELQETAGEWVVQLHADSGQIFFQNTALGLSTFMDPFSLSKASDELDEEDQKAWDEVQDRKINALSGYELAPEQGVFKVDEFVNTQKRLQDWVARNGHEYSDDDFIRLRYPVYVNVERRVDEHLISNMIILFPRHGAAESTKRKYTIDRTVGDVITDAVKKYKNLLDAEQKSRVDESQFVLKANGYQDYFIHRTFKLAYHDYIVECIMKNEPATLELRSLDEGDLVNLSAVLVETAEDALAAEDAKVRPDGDEYTADMQATIPANVVQPGRIDGLKYIPMEELDWPLRIIVRGVTDAPMDLPVDNLSIQIIVYYNGEPLMKDLRKAEVAYEHDPASSMNLTTTEVPFSSEPRWPGFWISSRIHSMADIPRGARIGFLLTGYSSQTGQRETLGGVAVPFIDSEGRLRNGHQRLRLWPSERIQMERDRTLSWKGENQPRKLDLACSPPVENYAADAGVLYVVFDSYELPVIAQVPTLDEYVIAMRDEELSGDASFLESPTLSPRVREQLSEVEARDPLKKLSHQERIGLWRQREWCRGRPCLLPKFLRSVNWAEGTSRETARRMLVRWAEFEEEHMTNVLELLDIRFCDPVVREYAVRQIDRMRDHELEEYMLQLVQVLKYECYDDSPLARMLIRRALASPFRIGHQFFWLLRSEMHNLDVSRRFGVILSTYVRNCGPHRTYLDRQVQVNTILEQVAEEVKKKEYKGRRREVAQAELRRRSKELPRVFQMCLTPRIECCGINYAKCKIMDSKKLPLWVNFINADQRCREPFLAIFKCGDDLRQDLMTLQVLRIMDKIWKKNDQNLRLRPYGCCSTGFNLGMIEVVKNSATTAHIQTVFGGRARGAFLNTPILNFLDERAKENRTSLDDAIDNFVHSCAGYCVATYVMGIGDRHADNIMVTETGHLFHIDFGHFLGNFKTKFGVKRERAPFVFTPEMAYVMGNKSDARYKTFEENCFKAFNSVRKQGALLINLFVLMVPAAMPELLKAEDVSYLGDMLRFDLDDARATEFFKGEIKKSLGSVTRRLDNWIHNIKHG